MTFFEISLVPAPINARTRVISWEGGARRQPPILGDLRRLEREVGVEELELARRRDQRSLRRRADDVALECTVGGAYLRLDALDEDGEQTPAATRAGIALKDPIVVEARRQMARILTDGPAKSLAELRQEAAR